MKINTIMVDLELDCSIKKESFIYHELLMSYAFPLSRGWWSLSMGIKTLQGGWKLSSRDENSQGGWKLYKGMKLSRVDENSPRGMKISREMKTLHGDENSPWGWKLSRGDENSPGWMKTLQGGWKLYKGMKLSRVDENSPGDETLHGDEKGDENFPGGDENSPRDEISPMRWKLSRGIKTLPRWKITLQGGRKLSRVVKTFQGDEN